MEGATLELTDHTIESELSAMPPRAVRLNGRAMLVCASALFLFAAFAACGTATLREASRLHTLAVTGKPAVATVTQIDYAEDRAPTTDRSKWSDANAPSVSSVSYRFRADDGSVHVGRIPITLARTEAGVSAPAPLSMLPGDKFTVRYAIVSDSFISRPWAGPVTKKIAFLVFAGLAAILIGAYLAWRALRWVNHAYRLIRTGFISTATVLSKEARVEDSPRFYVAIGYTSHDGVMRQKTVQCTSSQYQKIQSGQTFTVIYPPLRPEEASLYAMLPFGR